MRGNGVPPAFLAAARRLSSSRRSSSALRSCASLSSADSLRVAHVIRVSAPCSARMRAAGTVLCVPVLHRLEGSILGAGCDRDGRRRLAKCGIEGGPMGRGHGGVDAASMRVEKSKVQCAQQISTVIFFAVLTAIELFDCHRVSRCVWPSAMTATLMPLGRRLVASLWDGAAGSVLRRAAYSSGAACF